MSIQYNQEKQTDSIQIDFPAELAHLRVLHLENIKIINKNYSLSKYIKLYGESMFEDG